MTDPTQPSLWVGKVTSTKDAEGKLGRVIVEVPGPLGPITLPPLRVVQPTASATHGTLFLPEIGDQVLVLRGAGNSPDAMFVLGALYHGESKPKTPEEDDANNVKQIVTRAGHELTFTDKDGEESILLLTGDQKLGMLLDVKEQQVAVFGGGAKPADAKVSVVVDLKNGKVIVTGDAAVEVAADEIKAEGKTVTVSGSDKVSVSGKTVEIAGQSEVKVTGAKISLG